MSTAARVSTVIAMRVVRKLRVLPAVEAFRGDEEERKEEERG
eukprot:CAMPEP_0175084880 /NCGR_PEP_ID=MMETSP0052_2-20121109/28325_1 /TAXON_ID=51329 ORGANISM="Polytomella parva, Strain SAG 63-3" /NCGR_SAMPLE_ID=MMETSP0052_2 /ASSEMBLY_ACC=CAM_ASM_000194 /LENGTH=41 /DNA_ID= /DNA_START= /DNA_END= /DNA_ORIENTATION=